MFVNNEVGTVQQIYDIQDIIAETNAYFHVDAVQAIGHLVAPSVEMTQSVLLLITLTKRCRCITR